MTVLDGAILVISAKDGVQAQTRILFHALRKMDIPPLSLSTRSTRLALICRAWFQSVRDKLSADIIIKQTVSLSPEIVLEENTDIEAWDAVIENNDALLEKYIAGEPISQEKLAREEQRRVQDASLFRSIMAAPKGPWHSTVDGCGDRTVPTDWGTGAPPHAAAFSRLSTPDCGQRRVYLRLYSGTLRLVDTVALAGREKLKITEMRIPSKGKLFGQTPLIRVKLLSLPSDSVRLKRCIRGSNPAPS